MFDIEVRFYNKNEIGLIYEEFSNYESIKYLKTVRNKYRFTYSDRSCKLYSYNEQDHIVVYYDENEYIAECLVNEDIIKKVKFIDTLPVKYKKI